MFDSGPLRCTSDSVKYHVLNERPLHASKFLNRKNKSRVRFFSNTFGVVLIHSTMCNVRASDRKHCCTRIIIHKTVGKSFNEELQVETHICIILFQFCLQI